MTLSKRIKTIQEKIDTIKDYDIEEAIELLKSAPKVKFNESVDVSVNLGIDASKSDQGVSCLLYTSPSPRDVEESRMPSSA